MNNNKKKITTVVLLLAFLAIAVTGGTLAYFTDSEKATNTFVMGNVKIALDESKIKKSGDAWVTDGTDRVATNNYATVYPGAEMKKDPIVHNIGTNDAYVRVKVTVDNGQEIMPLYGEIDPLSGGNFLKLVKNTFDGTNWTYGGAVNGADNSVVYTLTYNARLEAGSDTTSPFEKVYFPAWIDNAEATAFQNNLGTDGVFNINVVAEAIQADGFTNVTEAFAAYDTQKATP